MFQSTDVPLLSLWIAKAGFLEEWGLLEVLKKKWGISVWPTLPAPRLQARGTRSRSSVLFGARRIVLLSQGFPSAEV